MKPSSFRYCAPETVEEALDVLEEHGDEAKALAGGQSLVPLLNLRVIRPAVLVDLNGIESLAHVTQERATVRIGATARQRAVELDGALGERLPLLREALGLVAHIPIRTRGTLGGSVVHADPAAEIPAVTVALGASMHVASREGTRTIPASDFYLGPFLTSLSPTEILLAVDFPPPPAGAGWAFVEVARVHGAFALAGVAALLHAGADGTLDDVRLVLCGVGATPTACSVDEIVLGERPSDKLFGRVAQDVHDTVEPFSDGHAGAEYRREVAGVLAQRALRLACARAGLEVAA